MKHDLLRIGGAYHMTREGGVSPTFLPFSSCAKLLSATGSKFCVIMMTSSNGTIFRVTGLLCGEFTWHNDQWRGDLMSSLICAWINGWVNNRAADDLLRHWTHYDVIVMNSNALLNTLEIFIATSASLSFQYIPYLFAGYVWKCGHHLWPLVCDLDLNFQSNIFIWYISGKRSDHQETKI